MAQEITGNHLHAQAHALTNAENHIGELITQIQKIQAQEAHDVTEARENLVRFQILEAELNRAGLPALAATAREGAELEARQIARNERLIAEQAALIGVLQAIAGGINKVRQFAHTFARAVSNFLA